MTHPPVPFGPALLFCPADRPDRYEKAAERADAVILDLEDAVADGAKRAARVALVASTLDPERVIVRINPASSPHFADDLAALAATGYRTVMLAKCEGTADLVGLEDHEVIALCETARGVLAAGEVAALPNVSALMWGAEDLVASLGGSSSRRADGGYRDVAAHARSQVNTHNKVRKHRLPDPRIACQCPSPHQGLPFNDLQEIAVAWPDPNHLGLRGSKRMNRKCLRSFEAHETAG